MKTHTLFFFLLLCAGSICAQEGHESVLPGTNGRTPAIEYEYFPSRMHAFIWRNWTVVPKSRLAEVIGATEQQIEDVAKSMGLPKQAEIQKEWLSSCGYITVLRRNWHLLPYEQLTVLLGLSDEELAWKLKEDDFLYIKLGRLKPYCTPLKYSEPTATMNERAHEISLWMKEYGKEAFARETPRFDFINDFRKVSATQPHHVKPSAGNEFDLRLIFPYFADYGDPLLDTGLSSFPEGMFQRLSDVGINGIWIHSVLRMFVPPVGAFPGDENALKRIRGLQNLVNRAAKYGIKIYLYMNEPRSMTTDFFASSPERAKLGGAIEGESQAFCTSCPDVINWLTASVSSLFTQVKGLGGVFSITASENLTSCVSHNLEKNCERCKHSSYAQLIVDVNKAIEKGVHSANPDAMVIVWDWGWKESDCEEIIRNLPKGCRFMSVSEWAKPINRGGVPAYVGEYSLSEVGPSQRTRKHWQWAKESGLKTVAKVQVNSSWEFSAVPALPVLDLVAEHAENLSKESVDGVMLSWSLGGYPSLNLNLFQNYKAGAKEQMLNMLAEDFYGKAAVADIRKAWTLCSNAFKEFPFHTTTLYFGPQHMGPANPLYIHPTGYSSSMVGFPYDDFHTWRAVYPVSTWTSQMQKVVDGFVEGAKAFRAAEKKVKGEHARRVHTEWLRCEVARIHLSSSVLQMQFYEARDRRLNNGDPNALNDMREAAVKEALLIKQLLPLVKEDATIGYESSNHYFYLPIDLLEAYLSIKYTLNRINSL